MKKCLIFVLNQKNSRLLSPYRSNFIKIIRAPATSEFKLFYRRQRVPMNKVENLEAFVGPVALWLKWDQPLLSQHPYFLSQSNWHYRVKINKGDGDIIADYVSITALCHIHEFKDEGEVNNVGVSDYRSAQASARYEIRVQAYSQYGPGPWSDPLVVHKLGPHAPAGIVLADQAVIYQIDLWGRLQGSVNQINSLTCLTAGVNKSNSLQGEVFILWSDEKGIYSLAAKNTTSLVDHQPIQLLGHKTGRINSLVYEPLAGRVYYTSLGRRGISRVNPATGVEELFLALDVEAMNLMVASALGQICWISYLVGLECALLDGAARRVIFDISFADQKVSNAAMDPEQHHIYFLLTRPFDYHKHCVERISISGEIRRRTFGCLPVVAQIKSPLVYFAGRLLFNEDQEAIVTYDLEGRSMTRLYQSSDILSFAPLPHTNLGSSSAAADTISGQNVCVEPSSIEKDSVRIARNASGHSFHLSWSIVPNDKNCEVKYTVRFHRKEFISNTTWLTFTDLAFPSNLTTVQVSISAATLWAVSPVLVVKVTNPKYASASFWTSKSFNIIFISAGIVMLLCTVCACYCCSGGNTVLARRKPELKDRRKLSMWQKILRPTDSKCCDGLPTYEELSLIPNIEVSRISMTKRLGKGAFGEVFQGLMKVLDESGEERSEMKIAVKTLPAGATKSEMAELVKEAKRMWNLKHEHILSVYGICRGKDNLFLILELMEEGDLLVYLRGHRSRKGVESLELFDLLQMCLDVAKGK